MSKQLEMDLEHHLQGLNQKKIKLSQKKKSSVIFLFAIDLTI